MPEYSAQSVPEVQNTMLGGFTIYFFQLSPGDVNVDHSEQSHQDIAVLGMWYYGKFTPSLVEDSYCFLH